MKRTLRINGQSHTVKSPGDTPLLWLLRDELGLTGTKYGCGRGHCGACTVHLDGRAARACLVTVAAVGGAAVTTIEHLHTRPRGADLQAAWKRERVPQCGYCQSGQLMSAAALLAQTPRPRDQEISAAMAGNLCRCGTYARVKRAIRQVARGES